MAWQIWLYIFYPIVGIITMIILVLNPAKKSNEEIMYKDLLFIFFIGFFGGYFALIIGIICFVSSLPFWNKPIKRNK